MPTPMLLGTVASGYYAATPVAFKTALGTQVATTTATTTVITTTAAIAVDDLIVVRIAADNTSSSLPTFTCADSGSNSYMTVAQKAVGAAAAGVAGAMMISKATSAISAGGTITVTQSATSAARAASAESFTGCSATLRSVAVTASGSAGTAAASGNSGAVASGDLVLGLVCAETRTTPTADADTTNGSWSTIVNLSNAAGGTDDTRVQANGQYKIANASGAQAYNNTIGATTDWIAAIVVLAASVPQAVRFDASGEKYSRSASGFPTGSFTWTFWAKVMVDRNTSTSFMSVDIAGSDYLYIGTNTDGTTMRYYSTTGEIDIIAMPLGVWCFAAVVWTPAAGTNNDLYWARAGDTSLSTNTVGGDAAGLSDSYTLFIGNSGYGSWCNASIAAVKVWSAALNSTEIAAEYPKIAPQRTSNLWASYSFSAGTQTTDDSGNGRTLTAAGSPTADANGPPIT